MASVPIPMMPFAPIAATVSISGENCEHALGIAGTALSPTTWIGMPLAFSPAI